MSDYCNRKQGYLYKKMTVQRFFVCFILCVFTFQWGYAAHIVGGEITYRCLGENRYEFTMYIYRDCASEGADFDGNLGASVNAATVSIFRGTQEIERLGVRNPIITNIPSDLDNPCLEIPDDVCVEEGIYVFTVLLPQSPENYTVTYQRCCRNNTINNLINPGETGATYTIDLTPQAQAVCNNSPVFNEFPPILICQGEPLSFNHSATDADGDQLIYEFCTPFLGGGTDGSTTLGDPESPTGVAPNPDLPPPYIPVNYVVPPYSGTNPMSGNPQITINPNTGIITGTPEILGQFVVGVCVREFRNGTLLSTVRRDFQFNVEACDPLVFADIREDEIIGNREYVVNSCGNNTVLFENESVQQQNIDAYFWEFDIDGTIQMVDSWDATVTFPDTGTYMGQLFLNPGTTCADTATIFVNVYPDMGADFSFDYDTCIAAEVRFFDNSFTESGFMTDWFWEFGDGGTSDEVNPEYFFETPGVQEVSLTVIDTNDCQETLIQDIYWVPAPTEIIVEPSTFNGCAPEAVFFDNLSVPIDSTYDILWDFGDGNTSTEISPTHTYEEPGVYSITLDIVSPIGCEIGAAYPNWVTMRESPEAGFTYTPENPSNFNPDVDFTDQSKKAVSWDWFFGDEATSFAQNPSYTFPDTGRLEVVQVVTHQNGCQDSAVALLDIEPIVLYFLPNAFTPNNDDTNDEFVGNGFFVGMQDFEMTIWNRWGEKMFETNDPKEGWNGRKNNVGQLAPNGVYVVFVRYLTPRFEPIELKGYATLLN